MPVKKSSHSITLNTMPQTEPDRESPFNVHRAIHEELISIHCLPGEFSSPIPYARHFLFAIEL